MSCEWVLQKPSLVITTKEVSQTIIMNYYSTNKLSPIVDFKEATIKGQAPDKGLYFPEYIPQLPKGFIENLKQYSMVPEFVTLSRSGRWILFSPDGSLLLK